jgi:hypothetical protein
MDDAKTLFEDMSFTVTDCGAAGVEVAFSGIVAGDETSGSKWYTDAAGEQVREICEREGGRHAPRLLSQLTGVEKVWQTIDRAQTKWSREGVDHVIYADKAVAEDGTVEYWISTCDDDGEPDGPRATAEVFDIEGARAEATRLAAAGSGPNP